MALRHVRFVWFLKRLCLFYFCEQKTKRNFLKYFLKVIKNNGVDKQKKKKLKKEIKKSIQKKSKRSTGESLVICCAAHFFFMNLFIFFNFFFLCLVNECTVGNITQVTISDETFPFDYDDINQFNFCLSATIVKNNLASITGKVDQEDYLSIVLSKLREVGDGGQ